MIIERIIVIVIGVGVTFLIMDYKDVNLVNFDTLETDFWASYFSIVIAVLLPLYLFSKEVKAREESEEQSKKDIVEKEEKYFLVE